MNTQTDVDRLAGRCRELFDLGRLALPAEYRYASVGNCVLDAVFSIGVKYGSTRLVVKRYCEKRGIAHYRSTEALTAAADQEPLSAFVTFLEVTGPEAFAQHIIENRQRTSVRSGILKADACLQFARVLRSFNVDFLQDLPALVSNSLLDTELRAVTGQSSGIAVQYFWMLAGSQDLIKPDRMVIRFIIDALSRPFKSTTEANSLLIGAAQSLRQEYPSLNARLLDYAIWDYQRQRPRVQSIP